MRLAFAAALSLAAAACGQGDSGNVMATGGNALSPTQVDAALGPELGNVANEPATVNELNAVEAPAPSDEIPQDAPEPESGPEPANAADEPALTENSE